MAAIGGVYPAGRRDPAVFDVRAYGAIGNNTTNDMAAIQAAIDAATAHGIATGLTATVHFPSGSFRIQGPLHVWGPNVTFDFARTALIRASSGTTPPDSAAAFPIFAIGIPPQNGIPVGFDGYAAGQGAVNPNARPDAFGVLDTSVAPASGLHLGYRTAHAPGETTGFVFPHGALMDLTGNSSDWLSNQSAVTLECCFRASDGGQFPNDTMIVGCGRFVGEIDPEPWILYSGTTGELCFSFRLNDVSRLDHAPYRTIKFVKPSALTGLIKLTLQIDFSQTTADSAITAWYEDGNKVRERVSLDLTSVGAWTSGYRFAKNEYYPVIIGQSGGTHPEAAADIEVYGFRYAVNLAYDPTQSNLVRIGGGTVNDNFRFQPSSNTRWTLGTNLGYVYPNGTDPRRWPSFGEKNWTRGYGITYSSLWPKVRNVAFRQELGASIQSSSGGYAMLVGPFDGLTLDQLSMGSAASFGLYHLSHNLRSGTLTANGCWFAGSTAPLILQQCNNAWLTDTSFAQLGRTLVVSRGSNLVMDRSFVAGSGNVDSVIRVYNGSGGGMTAIRSCEVDIESGGVNAEPIWVERQSGGQCCFEFANSVIGGTNSRTLIWLDDVNDSDPPGEGAECLVYNVSAGGSPAWMRTNGPRWSGQVVVSHNHDLAAVAEHVDTFGARSNVALVDFNGLNGGTSYAGV